MQTIGEKIYDLRRKKDLSQEQLGFEINVSRQTISKWEAGSMNPTTENIAALCEYFNVTSNYFFDDVPPQEKEAIATTSIPSKKKMAPFICLIVLCSTITVIGIIIGSIAAYLALQPPLGANDIHTYSYDTVAIVSIICALIAIISLISIIILFKKRKK